MAIVPMHKIFLAAMKDQRSQVLEVLQRAGVVQIEDFVPSERETFSAYLEKDSVLTALNSTEDAMFRVKTAIDALSDYDRTKKPLFAAKTVLSQADWQLLADRSESLLSQADAVCRCLASMKDLTGEQNHLTRKIEQLSLYRRYELPLEEPGTRYTTFFVGCLSALFDPDELKAEAAALAAEIFVLEKNEENIYISALCLDRDAAALRAMLDARGYRPLAAEGLTGTVAAQLQALTAQRSALEQKQADVKQQLSQWVGLLPDLKALYDYYLCQHEIIEAREKLAETKSVFFLQGWLPAAHSEKLQQYLKEKFPVSVISVAEPEADEEYPVLLRNNGFVEPFELVTELYSTPSSREIDPNPVMSIFYFVFFGMMLSDAGYGIVLALLTGFILAKFKPEGTMGKLLKLIFFGGLSTIFWGVLFGGWFGDLLSGVPAFRPLWFNPLEDPMRLLLWSFVFGGVHIVAGMAMKARLLIRDGRWLDALFDIGSWYVLFAGLILWFLGFSPVVAAVGALSLLLTQGRHEKNIFKKLTGGLLSLYDITGYVSDILSYSRLLALGLATGVIGQVVNTMGKLGGNSVFGI
ncbi:MAG: V-type ATP synthase subunit I, partial [Clostridia bacterium]